MVGAQLRTGEVVKRISMLLSLGLASALVLAACGGDDDNGNNGADAGNTPASGQTTTGNTPTNGGGQATNTPSSDPGGGNGGDASELEDLLGRFVDRTFKATFATSFTDEGVTQEGTITIAQDAPRYAMSMESPEGDFGVYENEDGSFSCFGSEGFGQCSRGSLLSGSFFDIRDVAEDEADLTSYRRIEDRNVGGRDSRCWQGIDSETNSENTVCLSKADGILTYVGGDGFEMTLQDFSSTVSDEDFKLPYSVR
jgi:hypothetical protein